MVILEENKKILDYLLYNIEENKKDAQKALKSIIELDTDGTVRYFLLCHYPYWDIKFMKEFKLQDKSKLRTTYENQLIDDGDALNSFFVDKLLDSSVKFIMRSPKEPHGKRAITWQTMILSQLRKSIEAHLEREIADFKTWKKDKKEKELRKFFNMDKVTESESPKKPPTDSKDKKTCEDVFINSKNLREKNVENFIQKAILPKSEFYCSPDFLKELMTHMIMNCSVHKRKDLIEKKLDSFLKEDLDNFLKNDTETTQTIQKPISILEGLEIMLAFYEQFQDICKKSTTYHEGHHLNKALNEIQDMMTKPRLYSFIEDLKLIKVQDSPAKDLDLP